MKSDDNLTKDDIIIIILVLIFAFTICLSFIGLLARLSDTFPCASKTNLIDTDKQIRYDFGEIKIVKKCIIPVDSLLSQHYLIWLLIVGFIWMETIYWFVIPKSKLIIPEEIPKAVSNDKIKSIILASLIILYFIGLYSIAQILYYNLTLDIIFNIISTILYRMMYTARGLLYLIPIYLWYKFNARKYEKIAK